MTDTAATARGSGWDERFWPLLIACLGAVGAVWGIAILLWNLLPADPGVIPPAVLRDFFQWKQLRPEPSERTSFLVALILVPPVAIAAAWLAGRKRVGWARTHPFHVAFLAALVIVWLTSNSRTQRMVGTHSYALWLAALETAVALAVARRVARAGGRPWPLLRAAAFGATIGIAIFFAFSWRTFGVQTILTDPADASHLDPVLYTTVQALAGHVPVADYPSQYGFFGTLLAPWFHILGLSVLTFTATMNTLVVLALAAVISTCFREMRSGLFAVGATLPVIYFVSGLGPLRPEADPYFQVAPIRFLFPALSLWIVARWIRHPTPRLLRGMSVFAGVGLIWNLDSGVAVTGSWFGLLGMLAIGAWLSGREWRQPARELGVAIACTAVPILLFLLWVRIRAGAPVPWAELFTSQRLFYSMGYYMIELPALFESWQAMTALYMVAFVLGSARVLSTLRSDRWLLVLYLSFLGFGLFAYYQGRSHVQVLMAVVWPSVVIAFLLADRAWELYLSRRIPALAGVAIAAPVLVFGAVGGAALWNDVDRMRALREVLQIREFATPGIESNLQLIRTRAPQRDIILLSRFQGIYLAETGHASLIRGPGIMEIITHTQAAAIIADIARHPNEPIFIGGGYMRPGRGNLFNDLLPVLASRYVLADSTTGESLRLYLPRP